MVILHAPTLELRVLPRIATMIRSSRNTIYLPIATACLFAGFYWFAQERPATIDVVSIGNEVDGSTPIHLDVTCGGFSRCVITCDVNGRKVSRSESQDSHKATVKVLTSSKKHHQLDDGFKVLYTVAVGDRIVVSTPTKKVKLFECVDDLNQRWEHFVSFLP